MGVEPEWVGEFIGEEASDRTPVDPADQRADEPADRHRMIAVEGIRIGRQRLRGEQRLHLLEIGIVVHRQRSGDAREARRVRHDMADEDAALAGAGEFRPVARDGGIEIERAALDQLQHAGRHQALCAGIDHLQRVRRPGPARRRAAAPDIDDRLPAMGRGESGAEIAADGEVAREFLRDRLETGRDMAPGRRAFGSPVDAAHVKAPSRVFSRHSQSP